MSQQSLSGKAVIAFWLSSQTHKRFSPPRILFLLFVLFLPTQLGKHFWPQESFVLGLRIDYLSPTLYLTDILLFCLLGSILLLKGREFSSFVSSCSTNPLVRFSALLFAVATFSSLFVAERPLLVLYGVIKVSEMVITFLCTWFLLRDREFRLPVILAFSCGMVFESMLALMQFIFQSSIGGMLYFLGERTFSQNTPSIALSEIGGALLLRPYGTLPHPNVLAGYLLLGSILILSLIPSVQNGFVKRWFSGVILLSFLGIVLSLSRVGIALSFLLILSFSFSIRHISKWSITWIRLLIVVIGFLMSPLIYLRFLELSQESQAVQERLFLLTSAGQMVLDRPFTGVGLNHFLVMLPSYMTNSSEVFLLQPVHNIVVLVLAEGGILTLVGVMLLVILLFKRVLKSSPQMKFSGLMILLAILVIGMADHYFLTVQQGQLLVSFVIGYLMSQTTPGTTEKSSPFPLRAGKNLRTSE